MKGSRPASNYIEIHEYDGETLLVRESTIDDICRDKDAKGDPAPYVVTRTSGQLIRVSEREAGRLCRLLRLGDGGEV